jgi:hypothetical protein
MQFVKPASLINEAANTIESAIFPSLEKYLGRGRVNSKNGKKDIRFDLGGIEILAIKSIKQSLHAVGINNVIISIIAPADYKNGSNSGKFFTHVITMTESVTIGKVNLKKGDIFKIVDNTPPKGSIKSKELTPSSLNIPEDTNLNSCLLKSYVISNVNTRYSKTSPHISSLLIELYNLVSEHKPSFKFSSPLEIKSFRENISFSFNTKRGKIIKQGISMLGVTDLNSIGKDFGEILGAALMLNIVETKKGISFPSGNNPLIDFFIDGYGISSKYQGGASPTLTSIIKNLDLDNFIEKHEIELYKLFKIIISNGVIDGYVKGAAFMNIPSAIKLKQLTEILNLNSENLEKFAQTEINKIGQETFYYKYVKPLVDISGRGNSTFNSVSWDKLETNKKFVGLLTYSLSLQLVDKLNGKLGDGELYINTLRKIVSKLEVKQLYMDVCLNSDIISFNLKEFNDENAKLTFESPCVSVPNPGNARLGFKMK